jgi:hypothetical protein
LKLLGENIREPFQDTGIGNGFLDRISKAQETEARIKK